MKVILLLSVAFMAVVETYVLNDLIQKLNGYDKKWVSGLNTKFINISLEDTMKMMGTPLPIKPEDRLPEREPIVLRDIPESFDSR